MMNLNGYSKWVVLKRWAYRLNFRGHLNSEVIGLEVVGPLRIGDWIVVHCVAPLKASVTATTMLVKS